MDGRKIFCFLLVILLENVWAQNCGTVMKTFHSCMNSDSSSGQSLDVSGTETKLRQCFEDAGCTEPQPLTASATVVDDEDPSEMTRPGQSIMNAVAKCVDRVKQEDIHPRLQACMSAKVPGWQFPDLINDNGRKSQASDQMLQLKRRYMAGIQSSCSNRQAKTEARKCFKSLRREMGGRKAGKAAHRNSEGNPQKREQCVQRISQECRSVFDNAHQYICDCAGEHLRDQSIRAQLSSKLDTCARAELRSISLNPEQTQKLERTLRKAKSSLAQKCKGQGRGGRRRGQGHGRRQKGGADAEDEE